MIISWKHHETEIKIRKANILDLPFIFELLLEGCKSGAFNYYYLDPKGTLKLFFSLLRWIVGNYIKPKVGQQSNLLVVENKNKDLVGFVKLYIELIDCKYIVLDAISIAPEYRNNGIATNIIHELVANTAPDYKVRAVCTKYARVMQGILKSNGFARDKKGVLGMELYESRDR